MITDFRSGEQVEILLEQEKTVGKCGQTTGSFDPKRGTTGTLSDKLEDRRGLRMVRVDLTAPNVGYLWLMAAAVSYVNGANGTNGAGSHGVR